ncbi:MAG: choice-of-anchor B family protein [Candidatus Zixiibacteriota bacterium]
MGQNRLFFRTLAAVATTVALIAPLATAEITANLYHSGDSIHELCFDQSYQFATTGGRGGSGGWGYHSPSGTEYALMGVYAGIAVVNTATKQIVGTIPGPQAGCSPYYWREMRAYSTYAYAVSECTGTNAGLMVINMTNLPSSISLAGTFPIDGASLVTSHSLSIDTVKGYAYLEGNSVANNALRIHNLANPATPAYVASFGPAGGIHDCQANNDTVWIAEGWSPSFSVYNTANKLAPTLIQRVTIPSSGYVHNIWPSDNRNYAATTEETVGKTVKIWDISNYGSVTQVGQWLGLNNFAHNVYWKGDRLYLSHYESGLYVVDVNDPSNPVEMARYDTWGTENPADAMGAWGAYPFTNNGLFYATNMDGKLIVTREYEAVLYDTMWVSTDSISNSGGVVELTVSLSNSHPVRSITVPVSWDSTFGMTFDSVSVQGTRISYFQSGQWLTYNPGGYEICRKMTSSTNETAPDLAPGSGPVMKVYFTVPPGVTNPFNAVRLIPTTDGKEPSITDACVSVYPDTLQGGVQLNGSCCIGTRGNVNGDLLDAVNVVDLTYLVAYLFSVGAPPPCLLEGDVNGSGTTNVVDLTYLVAYLFSGGPLPPACP